MKRLHALAQSPVASLVAETMSGRAVVRAFGMQRKYVCALLLTQTRFVGPGADLPLHTGLLHADTTLVGGGRMPFPPRISLI